MFCPVTNDLYSNMKEYLDLFNFQTFPKPFSNRKKTLTINKKKAIYTAINYIHQIFMIVSKIARREINKLFPKLIKWKWSLLWPIRKKIKLTM